MTPAPDVNPTEPVPAPAVAPALAIPAVGPTGNEQPRPDPTPPPVTRPPTGAAPKLFLAVTALALAAWFAWLSVTALNKSRDPIVSRAQASIAPLAVRATVKLGKDGKPDANAVVVKALTSDAPKELGQGKELHVANLPTARGFDGDGEYLLLLAEPFVMGGDVMSQLVVFRTTAMDADPPVIYRWSPDVEKQAERLYRGK